jgi:hypothetical protein
MASKLIFELEKKFLWLKQPEHNCVLNRVFRNEDPYMEECLPACLHEDCDSVATVLNVLWIFILYELTIHWVN